MKNHIEYTVKDDNAQVSGRIENSKTDPFTEDVLEEVRTGFVLQGLTVVDIKLVEDFN